MARVRPTRSPPIFVHTSMRESGGAAHIRRQQLLIARLRKHGADSTAAEYQERTLATNYSSRAQRNKEPCRPRGCSSEKPLEEPMALNDSSRDPQFDPIDPTARVAGASLPEKTSATSKVLGKLGAFAEDVQLCPTIRDVAHAAGQRIIVSDVNLCRPVDGPS